MCLNVHQTKIVTRCFAENTIERIAGLNVWMTGLDVKLSLFGRKDRITLLFNSIGNDLSGEKVIVLILCYLAACIRSALRINFQLKRKPLNY